MADRMCNCVDIVGRYEHSGALVDELRWRGAVRGDDGEAGGHGLRQNKTERFVPAWVDQEV